MKVGFIVFGLLFGWSVIAHPASAGVAVTSTNKTWETSANLGVLTEPVQLFGALGSTGDARFYRLTVKKPGTMTASIDVPIWSAAKFHPQLVVYQPDSVTNGPALPMIQPPETIATVYPYTTQVKNFEAWTQISTLTRLQAKLDFPVAGKYYLAVYNADRASGRYRLTLTPSTSDSANSIMGWPKCWWVSHIWANPSITTLFAPLVFIAVIVLIMWTAMHWTKPTKPASRLKHKISHPRSSKK